MMGKASAAFLKKRSKKLLLLLVVVPLSARAQDCIREPDIRRTEIVDDSTILFHMRDHVTYRNTLQVACYGLKNEPDGFSYQPTDPSMEELCSNQVTIRLNSYRSICQLGNFTKVK